MNDQAQGLFEGLKQVLESNDKNEAGLETKPNIAALVETFSHACDHCCKCGDNLGDLKNCIIKKGRAVGFTTTLLNPPKYYCSSCASNAKYDLHGRRL